MSGKQAVSPALVVGGGVAGMQTALHLADAGIAVALVEREPFLGGQVFRLDKVYPTDHCAFCPVWPKAVACRSHPLIRLCLGTHLAAIEEGEEGIVAVLHTAPSPVDAAGCVFCGRCMTACPSHAIAPRQDDVPHDPAAAPCAVILEANCKRCGACAAVCPTGAIDIASLDRSAPTVERLPIRTAVFATGFQEPFPHPAPEFGAHSHPDILTAMAFERLTAEFSDSKGALRCPSDGRPARSIAFVQCAGARDRRHIPHCSTVCCMHAAKHARWMKRRDPTLDIAVYHTDLRTPGKGQEAYLRSARAEGVRFVNARPGLIAPLDQNRAKGILLRHEAGDKVASAIADIIVLNGGLACSPPFFGPSPALPKTSLPPDTGPFRSCGFCREPADIARSVIQAGAIAASLLADFDFAAPPAGEVMPRA